MKFITIEETSLINQGIIFQMVLMKAVWGFGL